MKNENEMDLDDLELLVNKTNNLKNDKDLNNLKNRGFLKIFLRTIPIKLRIILIFILLWILSGSILNIYYIINILK